MTSTRCAVCKYFRRRCSSDCIFSPYFLNNNLQKLTCVHKIYGEGNLGKLFQDMPVQLRADAVESLYYDAKCRIQDPVYRCVRIIYSLHQQIEVAQRELAQARAEIAFLDANGGVEEPTPSVVEPLFPQNGVDSGLDNHYDYWFY